MYGFSPSRIWRGVCDLRETLCVVRDVVREVIHETRDLAHLLWVEHERPTGRDLALLEAPKETRETWWQVATAALKAMHQDPDVSSDRDEPPLDELARLMRISHARALDRDATVPEPSVEEVVEWERLATAALAWRSQETSGSGTEAPG